MKLKIYQIDAFAEKVFEGNPAAVCPLDKWLEESLMQRIAQENNLSETAFFVAKGEEFELRWFTPTTEVNLCGHATMAAAKVIFEHLAYSKDEIIFQTKSGLLKVKQQKDGRISLDFPSDVLTPLALPNVYLEPLDLPIVEAFVGMDYLLLTESEEIVRHYVPDFSQIAQIPSRGLTITAKSETKDLDFVSRFFAPQSGVNEDPVTGSSFTMLLPYWAKKLGKNELRAQQVSARSGIVLGKYQQERVVISGKAVQYLQGEIVLPF